MLALKLNFAVPAVNVASPVPGAVLATPMDIPLKLISIISPPGKIVLPIKSCEASN